MIKASRCSPNFESWDRHEKPSLSLKKGSNNDNHRAISSYSRRYVNDGWPARGNESIKAGAFNYDFDNQRVTSGWVLVNQELGDGDDRRATKDLRVCMEMLHDLIAHNNQSLYSL